MWFDWAHLVNQGYSSPLKVLNLNHICKFPFVPRDNVFIGSKDKDGDIIKGLLFSPLQGFKKGTTFRSMFFSIPEKESHLPKITVQQEDKWIDSRNILKVVQTLLGS